MYTMLTGPPLLSVATATGNMTLVVGVPVVASIETCRSDGHVITGGILSTVN